MITIEGKKYIESQYIRVFPCAYRGYYNTGADETLVFDPEARATTEANFTSTFQKLSAKKESYVVSWDATQQILKCVIGGYYFEIYNYSIEDFFYEEQDDKKPYYFCIQTSSIDLGTSDPDVSDVRTTKILSSFDTTNNYLDVKQGNSYAFTGLQLSKEAVGTASLLPFTSKAKFVKDVVASDATDADKAAQLQRYYFDQSNNAIKITSLTELAPNDTQLYTKEYTYELNKTQLTITSLLDVGQGSYSIRMIEDPTEQGTNSTFAEGDYSIALGKNTQAIGEASIALGANTEASALGAFAVGHDTKATAEGAVALGNTTVAGGKGAIAVGNNTSANYEGAVALGTSTTAGNAHQVVLGKNNKVDSNQAFIIANGNKAEEETANKFTVSYAGDLKALGTLEVKDSIKVTGATTNSLELGTSVGGAGSIKVYGNGSTEVFTVADTGTTSIAGITTITKDTQSSSPTSGALKVAGGVGINKNLNVGGNVEIKGSTILGSSATDTLVVAGATTLNNGLTVKANKATTTVLETELSVDDDTVLKKDVTVYGNLTLAAPQADEDKPVTNTLILGSSSSHVSGALEIYGENDSKVFTVDNTGKIAAANDLSVAGKVTSQTTASTDSNDTLVTKSYVDAIYNQTKSDLNARVQTLIPEMGADAEEGTGKYVQSVAQKDGKITTTEMSFAPQISSSNKVNAPTSAAVYQHISTEISNLWTMEKVKKDTDNNTKLSLQSLVLDAVYPVGSIYMQYLDADDAEPKVCPLQDTLPDSKWQLLEGGRFLMSVGATTWGDPIIRGQEGGYPNTTLISHSHKYTTTTEDDKTPLTGGDHQHIVAFKAAKAGVDDWTGFEGNRGDEHAGYVIENTLTKKMYEDIIKHDKTLDISEKKDNSKLNQLANNSDCFGSHTHYLPEIANYGGHYEKDKSDKWQFTPITEENTIQTGIGLNIPPYIAVYMWRRTK